MITLREAVQITENRKSTILGDHNPDDYEDGVPVRIQYAASEEDDKAVFSGYDIDYDELVEVIAEQAELFCGISLHVGLRYAFRAAIADALHVGLVKGADSAH
jgi:hypothetical protein